jgi:feruloyl esterase
MSGLVAGVIAFVPAAASAQAPPTCAQLNTDPFLGFAGNPTVIAHTTTLVAATGNNRAYCRVDFTVSERGGPEHGYAVGEIQRVVLRVGLPLNSSDGGTGGGPLGEGAWNGKVQNLGGGGLVGSVGGVTSATNAGYVGSSTDSGHPASENPGFGVIQATHELNLGKIEDFFSESLRLQYQWALRLTKAYYTKRAARNYWSGCSTGGRQGLVLALKHGEDFDGFLIGAPHTNHVQNSTGGTFRQWANKDLAGGSVTSEKYEATVDRVIAACDGLDGVLDGILNEPRACQASAALNVCGQPDAAPPGSCLSPTEADVIDIAFDGSRNDLGHRVWFPSGRAAAVGIEVPTTPSTGGNGVFGWAMKDMTFDWRTGPRSNWDDLVELATNTFADYINMGNPDLSRVKNSGAKILM